MILSLVSTPTRYAIAGPVAENWTPLWVRPPARRPSGRRVRLNRGVYVIQPGRWSSPSVLDIAADLPVITDAEPRRHSIPMPDWHRYALCNGVEDADVIFFGVDDQERPALPPTAVKKARAYCAACPAARDCLTWALSNNEEFGIWAGTTGRQRRALKARLKAGATVEELVDECLTTAA